MRNLYLILLHIFLTFVVTHSAPKESVITNLPGFNGSLPSKHYGGYVTIDESHGKNLYYYFVESESNSSSKDPIVLWLNGGPGCSSFDGFGYLIGNPVADEIFDGNALVPFAHGMGLISDQIFENITKACNGTFYATNSSDCNHCLSNLDDIIALDNVFTSNRFWLMD
ncbi:unnamed protein product [Vicia faba]|uniref:Uncharacterized protein n=1 Tax=Vicia faba TaxID=3906 RepID=A0AAV1AQ42_VICFA|nr:unnamed protein product [Vicia faba]